MVGDGLLDYAWHTRLHVAVVLGACAGAQVTLDEGGLNNSAVFTSAR